MLARDSLEATVRTALNRARGVVLRGPRQSGKSTLARKFLGRESANYFDLEYPPHGQRLEHATPRRRWSNCVASWSSTRCSCGQGFSGCCVR